MNLITPTTTLAVILLLLPATVFGVGGDGQDSFGNSTGFEEQFLDDNTFRGFDVLSLSHAAALVKERFYGKLIAARLVPPFPHERQSGVELVHELRLLTPERDVLILRLDARTGAFLEVAGTGITAARKPMEKGR